MSSKIQLSLFHQINKKLKKKIELGLKNYYFENKS